MQDVFVNMAGGIRVEDPAIDLAVCISIISSLEELPVAEQVCFAAEVGLGGELRAVNRVEQRISEAEKLGFKTIYVSKFNQRSPENRASGIEVKRFGKLPELLSELFG
jgi:DNA repair protein RadA/Sms